MGGLSRIVRFCNFGRGEGTSRVCGSEQVLAGANIGRGEYIAFTVGQGGSFRESVELGQEISVGCLVLTN